VQGVAFQVVPAERKAQRRRMKTNPDDWGVSVLPTSNVRYWRPCHHLAMKHGTGWR
jgi:predicted glutamine amidotransferase